MESGSPPPRFSETGSYNSNGTPRFTEHFNNSPPYQGFAEYDATSAPIPRYEQPNGPMMHHRLSNKERSLSPSELVSPMPEAYQKDDEEKEVAVSAPAQPEAKHEPEAGATIRKPKRRVCGLPLMWLLIIGAIIIALAIGLGVGLGVGLDNNGHGSSGSAYETPANAEYLIGGAINPEYYSTTGAFNGSGIALAQQSFSADLTQGVQGSIVMYFQHWTGDIRYEQLSSTGSWLGGDESTIVASDAKNNTPLSAVSYVTPDYVSTWHLFYIDRNNTLRQRSNSNASYLWVDGPLNELELKVWDADQVGMQACWYGNDYGDSDYIHAPLPGTNSNETSNSDVGMHMWYASDNSTFQQYGWRQGNNTTWEYQTTFENKNGHAGVGCYSWGKGTVTYVMMVNNENTAEVWWRDTNTNLTNTTAHPINVWVNTTNVAVNNVYPTTSLGYTNNLYAQNAADLYFYGYNITWAAENSTIDAPFRVDSSDVPLAGSHLSVSDLPNPSGGHNLVVFFQQNGTDISEYTRDSVAGAWSSIPVSIPPT